MKNVAIAIIKINQIGGGHATLNEWQVIIFRRDGSSKEMGLVAQLRSCLVDQILQPGSGVAVPIYIQIRIANHVSQQKCLDVL